MSKLKQKILDLRSKGYSYNKIVEELGCSKATVCYYCGKDQHNKNLLRQKKRRSKQHPFIDKIYHFRKKSVINITKNIQQSKIERQIYQKIKDFSKIGNKKGQMKHHEPSFTIEDIMSKIGNNPTCYLTGQSIDLSKPKTYQFDHIIPRSRGGSNELDNLGLCTTQVNLAKRDLTAEEFINLCKIVASHHTNLNGP